MIRRTYACDECTFEWTVSCEWDSPIPDCPVCEQVARQEFKPIAIGTNKGKAIDYAQQMAEQDYGLTDMNDNMRAGDIAAKGPPPVQTAEAEMLTRQAVEMTRGLAADATAGRPDLQKQVANFWGGGQGVAAQANIESARAAALASKGDGLDPLSILDKAKNKPMDYNVIGASKLEA